MRKSFTIVSIFLSAIIANAQQIGMYSHYFYKPMVYNPAYTGYGDAASAMLISRSQWTDFKGAPQLTLFILDGNINLLNKKVSLGLGLINDRMGITSRTGGNLYYSYRLKLSEDMRLLFGLSIGVKDQTIDFSRAILENSSDPTVFTDTRHKTTIDANAGLAFIWKDLELGAAIPQVIGNKIKITDNTNIRAYYTEARHYMASVKYRYFIAKEKGISIVPQALVRFVPNVPFQFDGTVNLDWNNKFWVGTTYKSAYAMAANVGFCLHKQLYLGYSYDFIIGNLGKYSGMSQEIMVNFKFGKNKKQAYTVADTTPKIEVVVNKKPSLPVADTTSKLKNKNYQKEVSKLQTKIETNQEIIKELTEELARQSQKQPPVTQATNDAPPVVPNTKEGILENGGLFITKRSDFKDDKKNPAEKGFYVIVGIFSYRDFAEEEVKNFVKRGFINANLLYSESKQNNYVFAQKAKTKEEALQKVKEATDAGGSNVWILKLVD